MAGCCTTTAAPRTERATLLAGARVLWLAFGINATMFLAELLAVLRPAPPRCRPTRSTSWAMRPTTPQ